MRPGPAEIRRRPEHHRSAHDGRLLALLEEASRLIDGHCNRYFYVLHATRQFEANWWTAGMQQLLVPDLIAANSVRVAARFDGPPGEPRWRTASYRLYPLDAAPDQPWGRPHTRMAIDVGADLGVCPGAALPDCHAPGGNQRPLGLPPGG